MPAQRTCPSSADLEKLMTGNLPEPEVEQLAEHLEHCSRCADTIRGLHLNDTLLEAAQANSDGGGGSAESAVEQLIQHLKGKHPAAVEVTLDEAVQPPAGMPAGEAAEDVPAFLSVAQGPGELGRLGGYRVLKLLGAGGMGMVYQAEDVHLQRTVALKVMKPDVAKNPTARERFLREARAAAKLKSDHVVNIYQVGEDNQTVFLAMEFLQGMSLDDWLKKDRTPTLTQAARIGRQIALGLADAHACGLIHRDIKPGNIWLDSHHQGRVKLLDFGLARGNAEEIHLTQSGAIVGTPAYMAPEQARGEHVDHRVDLFSLGVVLYRLTTGQLPFRGDNTMSILTSLALDVPRTPREINPDIPPRMATLVERLLAKDREQRPATAKAVADELAALEREAPHPAEDEQTVQVAIGKRQPAGTERPARTSRLTPAVRRWLAVAALLLVLGGAAAAIVVILRDRQGKEVARVTVPEGGNVEVKKDGDDKPAPAVKESSPADERRAAQWVRSRGGVVSILVDGQVREIPAKADLPVGEWRLEGISLRLGKVKDADLVHLEGLTSLRRLDLAQNEQITAAGLAHIAGLTNLVTLDLSGVPVTDDGLKHLRQMSRLKRLDIFGGPISDAGLEHLKGLTSLEVLSLTDISITAAGLAHLRGLSNLTTLQLHRVPIGDAVLEQVGHWPKLATLNLGDTRVSDAGMKHLKPLKNLVSLSLAGNPIGDAGLEHLKGLTNLDHLNLRGTPITDAGLAHLQPMKKLGILLLAGTKVGDAGLQFLQPLENLGQLELSGTAVTGAGLKHLRTLKNLIYIHMDATRVSDAGLADLAALNWQFGQLDLRETRISAKGIASLRAALPKVYISWSEPNRSAAEAVCALGGTVHVRADGRADDRLVKTAAELPGEYFRVTRSQPGGHRQTARRPVPQAGKAKRPRLRQPANARPVRHINQ